MFFEKIVRVNTNFMTESNKWLLISEEMKWWKSLSIQNFLQHLFLSMADMTVVTSKAIGKKNRLRNKT